MGRYIISFDEFYNDDLGITDVHDCQTEDEVVQYLQHLPEATAHQYIVFWEDDTDIEMPESTNLGSGEEWLIERVSA